MFMSMIYTIEEKKSTGIYAIINTLNDKCYIGSASHSFLRRWYRHKWDLNKNKHHSPYLQRSWNVYGADSFEFKILEVIPEIEFVDNKYLTDIEQMYLDTYNPEYNVCCVAGSCKGQIWTLESKLKMSQRMSGKGNPNYGKTRIFSEEHRKQISDATKGKNNPMYGRTGNKSPIHNEKHFFYGVKGEKHPASKSYIVTNPEGIIFYINGLHNFCKQHELDSSSMIKVAKGKLKQHKKWLCAYPSTQNTLVELPV